MRKKWSEKEISFLRENYPHLSGIILSEKLSRPVCAIRAKANRYLRLKKSRRCLNCNIDISHILNAQRCKPCAKIHKKEYQARKYLENARKDGVKPRNLWKKEDFIYLRENYPYLDDETLARKLNRSVIAVRKKANKLLKVKKYRQCVDCGVNLTGRSPTIIRCDNCSKVYIKLYKRKWADCNADSIKLRLALWRANNHEYKKEQDRLWRIENREKKIKGGRLYYQKVRFLENERRKRLGLPLIGEGFRTEKELLNYVRILFNNEKIVFHDRSTLGGLELDIYLPNLGLAFEYQGVQHFKFIKHFHWNHKRFEEQQKRDLLTRRKCEEKGIKLIEIIYNEPLNEQLILSKLVGNGIKTNQLDLSFDKGGN